MLFGLVAMPVSAGDVPAFPGAEGFGARATGGRGGRVIVTSDGGYPTPEFLQARTLLGNVKAEGEMTVRMPRAR
jgi:hypothetical protein